MASAGFHRYKRSLQQKTHHQERSFPALRENPLSNANLPLTQRCFLGNISVKWRKHRNSHKESPSGMEWGPAGGALGTCPGPHWAPSRRPSTLQVYTTFPGTSLPQWEEASLQLQHRPAHEEPVGFQLPVSSKTPVFAQPPRPLLSSLREPTSPLFSKLPAVLWGLIRPELQFSATAE